MISNDLIFYENIYIPIWIIDSVWRSLIADIKIYKEFCNELWGGFIDRVDDRNSNEREAKQRQLKDFVNNNHNTFRPYNMLWPMDKNHHYSVDNEIFNVIIRKSELKWVVSKVEEMIMNNPRFSNVYYINWNNIVIQSIRSSILYSSYLDNRQT